MAEQELGYSCPVCLEAPMSKIKPSEESDLMLDYCRQCGGIWFEHGEVSQLRECRPKAVNATVVLSPEAWQMQCHSCRAEMHRTSESCSNCGWPNQLSCPVCVTELKTTNQGSLRLDVCPHCRGVWLDNTELAQIWNTAVEKLSENGSENRVPLGRFFLIDVVDFVLVDPHLASLLLGGAFQVGKNLFEAMPGIGGFLVDGTGELAKGAFDGIGDAVESIDFFSF